MLSPLSHEVVDADGVGTQDAGRLANWRTNANKFQRV